MLNETTATAMPMMVYENTFVALSTCDESPRAVRYSMPAYRPIATDVIEMNHANQLTRFAIVCTMLSIVVGTSGHGPKIGDEPVISATTPRIPGASKSSITPAAT